MEKGRYMLIHLDKHVYRFKSKLSARAYAMHNCRGCYEFYVIVDIEEDKVVEHWSY